MTLEEAGEEILKGPFMTCTHCKGDGTVLDAPGGLLIHDQVSRTGRVCRSCEGTGKWLRGDYLHACCILGIQPAELPKPRFGPSLFSPDEFKKLLEQVGRFRMEYTSAWHEPEERCDTADALAYAMRATPKSEPISPPARRYWPGRYRP